MRRLLLLTALAAGAACAADRPDLNGVWKLDAAHEGKLKYETLVIHQTEDGVDVSEAATSGGKEKKLDFTCGVDGKECKSKDGANVSFWYSDGVLVMMEFRHGNDVVVKTRMHPSDDGKTLNVEVVHVSPSGQNETYSFKKAN